MKWLHNDSRTTEALATGEGRKVKANFFFHDRGSEIQKSFKGLQGIVFQILQNTQNLLPLILPIRQKMLKRFDTCWTEEDLHDAFQILLNQQNLRLHVTLFIDALDEYSGTHESIIGFLSKITSVADTALTNIKICFSSRSLENFLDNFNDVQGFYIHEYTTDDIRSVIQSRMSQNQRMFEYMQEASPENRLLTIKFEMEVLTKAEGIFLWVKLVLDELLDEFTAGETLQGLMRKLVFLPPKLEDFYKHTLDRLLSRYHDDTKTIFEVLRCAIQPLRLHDFFEICRYTKVEKLVDCAPCTATNYEWNKDSVQRWTRSRTGGLVQLVLVLEPPDYGGEHGEDRYICPALDRRGESRYVIQFIHQTVKTFSQSTLRATSVKENRFPCHNGYAYIAKYILALLFHHRQSDSKNVWHHFNSDEENSATTQGFWGRHGAAYLIETLCNYISRAESETPKVLLSSLVEFGDDRISDLFHLRIWTNKMRRSTLVCVSAFAIVFDFCDLLDELLELEKGKIGISSPPLLHLAVSGFVTSLSKVDFEKRSRPIRSLLNHGADPSEIFEGHTPYSRLCEIYANIRSDTPEDRQMLIMVLPFLQAKQDPNARIRLSKSLRKRQYHSIEQCLLHIAAGAANLELVYAVLDYGANVNAVDDAGCTPLDCARDNGRIYRFSQLSEMVDEFLQMPPGSQPMKELRRRIQVASLLISRGGRFGVSSAGESDKFLNERRLVTQLQVDMLKSRGLEIDSRIVWGPPNQINTGISGFITGASNSLKSHIIS